MWSAVYDFGSGDVIALNEMLMVIGVSGSACYVPVMHILSDIGSRRACMIVGFIVAVSRRDGSYYMVLYRGHFWKDMLLL